MRGLDAWAPDVRPGGPRLSRQAGGRGPPGRGRSDSWRAASGGARGTGPGAGWARRKRARGAGCGRPPGRAGRREGERAAGREHRRKGSGMGRGARGTPGLGVGEGGASRAGGAGAGDEVSGRAGRPPRPDEGFRGGAGRTPHGGRGQGKGAPGTCRLRRGGPGRSGLSPLRFMGRIRTATFTLESPILPPPRFSLGFRLPRPPGNSLELTGREGATGERGGARAGPVEGRGRPGAPGAPQLHDGTCSPCRWSWVGRQSFGRASLSGACKCPSASTPSSPLRLVLRHKQSMS